MQYIISDTIDCQALCLLQVKHHQYHARPNRQEDCTCHRHKPLLLTRCTRGHQML